VRWTQSEWLFSSPLMNLTFNLKCRLCRRIFANEGSYSVGQSSTWAKNSHAETDHLR
jgi:hypothetical protein